VKVEEAHVTIVLVSSSRISVEMRDEESHVILMTKEILAVLTITGRFLNPLLMRDYLHVATNKQAGFIKMDTVGKGSPAFLVLSN
jgi:hypothetical protein